MFIDHEHKMLCIDESTRMRQQVQGQRIPIVDRLAAQAAAQAAPQGPIALPSLVRISVRFSAGASRDRVLRLDSGAGVPVLYDYRGVAKPQELRTRASSAHVIGESAQSFVALPPQDVRIGKHLLSQITFMAPLGAGPMSPAAGEDGLLPTRLFDCVFISFADHFVILTPH